ncbi:MAG: hypothetical protein K0S36_1533 [Nitrosospira multiformis]|jgi:hypothetical protein|nr:hypothetical protein [Nitrosospira multiformis]
MRAGIRRSGIEKNDMRLPLERWEYGNPEAVAERRQTRSCHGCRHESKIRMGWNNLEFCEKGRKHGVRCTFFQKKEYDK